MPADKNVKAKLLIFLFTCWALQARQPIDPAQTTPPKAIYIHTPDSKTIETLKGIIKNLTIERDQALAQLQEARQHLDQLRHNSYSKEQVDAQRDALLQSLAQLQQDHKQEIEALNARILHLTKASSPFTTFEKQ